MQCNLLLLSIAEQEINQSASRSTIGGSTYSSSASDEANISFGFSSADDIYQGYLAGGEGPRTTKSQHLLNSTYNSPPSFGGSGSAGASGGGLLNSFFTEWEP